MSHYNTLLCFIPLAQTVHKAQVTTKSRLSCPLSPLTPPSPLPWSQKIKHVKPGCKMYFKSTTVKESRDLLNNECSSLAQQRISNV